MNKTKRRIYFFWLKQLKGRFDLNLKRVIPSIIKLDVLIPVVEKDLEVLPYAIDSARENIKHPIGEIIIVAPDSEKIKALCKIKGCQFVNEDSVLPITKKEIKNRLDCLTLYADSNLNEIHVFSGISAKEISRYAETKVEMSSLLNGLTIWPGKIKGKARVMHSKDDIKNIIKGEILVCPMTDPDFMPAIYKASAVVTDQGGVLCHAAIIARELQKPCVVGTKIATQVIKTGDVIEVDATNGAVRILKTRKKSGR